MTWQNPSLHPILPPFLEDTMLTTIAVLHIIFIVALIGLVLLQDSKGGALGAFGAGGGSSSVFGSGGGANFLVKATRTVAILFATTSLTLAYMTSGSSKSLTDDFIPQAKTEQTKSTTGSTPVEKKPADTPAKSK